VPEARLFGIVATVGSVLFVVIVVALTKVQWSFLKGRGWDPVRTSDVPYPSTLALGPAGWLQVLNFAILGLALLAVPAGLWRALDPPPLAAAALLVVAGLAGLALMAPTDGSLSSVRTWHGAIHVAGFFTLLVSLVLTAVALGFAVADLPSWRWLSLPSIAAAVAIVLLTGASFVAPTVGGLASILSLVAMLAWLGLVAFALAMH
jgi:hypothetical protein